jgi:hypothetical protein
LQGYHAGAATAQDTLRVLSGAFEPPHPPPHGRGVSSDSWILEAPDSINTFPQFSHQISVACRPDLHNDRIDQPPDYYQYHGSLPSNSVRNDQNNS